MLDPYRRLTLLQFTVDPRIATERAATQRGEKWLERYDRLALDAGITGADRLDRIARRADELAHGRMHAKDEFTDWQLWREAEEEILGDKGWGNP